MSYFDVKVNFRIVVSHRIIVSENGRLTNLPKTPRTAPAGYHLGGVIEIDRTIGSRGVVALHRDTAGVFGYLIFTRLSLSYRFGYLYRTRINGADENNARYSRLSWKCLKSLQARRGEMTLPIDS